MSEFTDRNSKSPPNPTQQPASFAVDTVSEQLSDEQLIQLAREALAAATASSGLTNEEIRRCGWVLFHLRKRHKGKQEMETVCETIGFDLEYPDTVQYIAIALNKELAKYWDRLTCRGHSPLYAFCILTKHPKEFAKFRRERLKGSDPIEISRRLIRSYLPQKESTEKAKAEANPATPPADDTVSCRLTLRPENPEQEIHFVRAVVEVTTKFNCDSDPSRRFASIQEKINAPASNVE